MSATEAPTDGWALHNKAMDLYEEAIIARDLGHQAQYETLVQQAFVHEHQAALLLVDRKDLEPLRGEIMAGAAQMAIDAGQYETARKLIGHALTGDIADELIEELDGLLEQLRRLRQQAV